MFVCCLWHIKLVLKAEMKVRLFFQVSCQFLWESYASHAHRNRGMCKQLIDMLWWCVLCWCWGGQWASVVYLSRIFIISKYQILSLSPVFQPQTSHKLYQLLFLLCKSILLSIFIYTKQSIGHFLFYDTHQLILCYSCQVFSKLYVVLNWGGGG